ncbi:MAG: selenoneine biosynthesis selenosugar synthase SenB [Planctomycetota bacterium]|nr:selenoneine biosynthesis selenosugar synthase SenB [Planctomycetota bacterium]
MARILIVTPAPRGSTKGNRVTADRWARLLRLGGHRVTIRERFSNESCDVLITLHARKSAAAVQQCEQQSPDTPVVVVLTGTDLYNDIHRDQRAAANLERATRLVLLQSHGIRELPKHLRPRVRVILQSAKPPRVTPPPLKTAFEICVSGHLRPVKDPFRAALAARQLPAMSRIRITQIGSALDPAMERRALDEMARNDRYHWLGGVPNGKARQLLARSRLLVLSSKMEGGANVISEAIVASVPVLASKVSGSIGLLGDDYPGYFDVGSTRQLANLMSRCEQDEIFYHSLRMHVEDLAPRFTPQREQDSLQMLLDELLC